MWLVDFSTLLLIIAADFQLGLQGFFVIHGVEWIFGAWANAVFALMGLSAVWQLSRQRFF